MLIERLNLALATLQVTFAYKLVSVFSEEWKKIIDRLTIFWLIKDVETREVSGQ